jgi:hypothetical protein
MPIWVLGVGLKHRALFVIGRTEWRLYAVGQSTSAMHTSEGMHDLSMNIFLEWDHCSQGPHQNHLVAKGAHVVYRLLWLLYMYCHSVKRIRPRHLQLISTH